MSYQLNKLLKALNKLVEISPSFKNQELYPWDDGKIYIHFKGSDVEIMKVFDIIYGTVHRETSP